MQGFFRKVVTQHHRHHHLHRNLTSYTSSHRNIFHAHTAFSSLPKPLSQQQQLLLLGHRIPATATTSFLFPTQHYSHSHSQIRGFFSNPRIASKWRNSLARLTSTSRIRSLLLDFRPKLPTAHFHRNSFGFNQSSDLYRGWRSWIRRLTPNDVVLGLIIANVAVFLSWRIADEKFMINNFTVSLNNFKSGRLHTLITSAFSHIDTGHIISNMIGLYFFGMNIGRNFGPEFLLKLYLAGAVGGSIFYLVHQAYKAQTSKGWRFMSPSRELALGASGAVNAIMLLDIFLFPKATLYFDFIIPVPAILLGIFLIGKDMLRIIEGDSQISGAAHLGGAAVAAIAWARVRKGRF